MTDLTWTTEQRQLGDLRAWDRNPRQLSKHDADMLAVSIDKFNLADPLVINADGQIIGGHQRKRVMLDNGYSHGDLIDVRVPSRQLTDKEAEELNIRLNRNSGEWDFDILANEFELGELLEWGFTEWDLQIAPGDDEWADALGGLPDGDRAPFQQMTFTLHDDQAEVIKEALSASKGLGAFVDGQNENSNGNALARICEVFLGQC